MRNIRMRERVDRVGARLSIEGKQGTKVTLELAAQLAYAGHVT